MPLVISTTNSPGYTLVAVVDKVTTDGVDVTPALRWSQDDSDFIELGDFGSVSDAYIALNESTTIDGYYEVVIGEIDGSAENVRITILNNANAQALGVLYNIPLPLVNPEVTIDLTVQEDRN